MPDQNHQRGQQPDLVGVLDLADEVEELLQRRREKDDQS